jgi:hypothetical protein
LVHPENADTGSRAAWGLGGVAGLKTRRGKVCNSMARTTRQVRWLAISPWSVSDTAAVRQMACAPPIQVWDRPEIFYLTTGDLLDSLFDFQGWRVIVRIMNSDFMSDIREFVSLLWQYRPAFLVMIGAGVIIFVLLTIDTHRHRKRQKQRRKRLH